MFQFLALAATAVSAIGQAKAGQAAKKAADLNAFNIETDKRRSQTEALQRHNDRLEQFRSNMSANIASFSAMGRDIGGADRSVKSFLERQRQIAASDTARSDFMGMAEAMKLQQQATATRIEGRAAKQAAMIGSFTTLASGLQNFSNTMASGSSGGSSSAPSTSLRPRARPTY